MTHFPISTIIILITAVFLQYPVRASIRSMASIGGLTYMDPIPQQPKRPKDPNDPCNSLFWYPQHVPDYCLQKPKLIDPVVFIPSPPPNCAPLNRCSTTPPPSKPPPPPPQCVPIGIPCNSPPSQCPPPCPPYSISFPAPLVQPPVIPYPVLAPPPPPVMMPYPAPPPYPVPSLSLPSHLPSPYAPGPWFPPYPGYGPPPPPVFQPSIITAGVRILPFTDSYSELIERQNNKDIADMEAVLKRYECAFKKMC